MQEMQRKMKQNTRVNELLVVVFIFRCRICYFQYRVFLSSFLLRFQSAAGMSFKTPKMVFRPAPLKTISWYSTSFQGHSTKSLSVLQNAGVVAGATPVPIDWNWSAIKRPALSYRYGASTVNWGTGRPTTCQCTTRSLWCQCVRSADMAIEP